MSTEPKTTTIRVSFVTRDKIAKLAEQEGTSMTAVIDDAIREREKNLRWQKVAEQMERTRREDPEGWAEYLAEQDLWLGGPSPTGRIAPEWEGVITPPEGGRADQAG
ncbi:hypothetical protein [Microtetraspora malaysiensis]|uniref:hypothetical protein n=1 Tax=Microtetraspora malaysiensis TaxID=161358 RepID=UPI00082BD409|nr:hypothetical protein [Microtetraspora malaysiensis]